MRHPHRAGAVPVTEPGGRYEYPPEVKFEIRHDVKGDYARAAEFVDFNRVRLVCIQHEYGIFGGDDGGYILDFVHALRVPAIVTLHTVLKHPSENQVAIVRKLATVCPLGRLFHGFERRVERGRAQGVPGAAGP
jgi:hypothetical protein